MKIMSNDLLTSAHLTGRWFQRNHTLQSPLLGATIQFEIHNTEKIAINTINQANELTPSQYWACQIDNNPWYRWPASQKQMVFAVSPNHHRVIIMTGGNCDLDNVWNLQQDFALDSLEINPEGQMIPFRRSANVLILGDSITAGCWVNGKHASVDYRPETNYVGIAQQLLPDIELQRVAYSAAGVLRPGTGNVPPAKEWLTKLDAHTQIPAGQYNLVVIALGVNDRRFSQKEFESAYHEYVHAVIQRYHCPVALMVPFYQTFKNSIINIGQQFQLPVISTTDWCHHTTDGLHPNQRGSQEAGRHFALAIKQLLQ